jgi:signal transduction histidine kinase
MRYASLGRRSHKPGCIMSAQLEELVRENADVIALLQETAELQRLQWARELHDEIGGLVTAAVMDLTRAQTRMPPLDSELRELLERVRATLEAAIDVSRRMVEELRPSILDNFGLFAALKWQFKKSSRDSNAACSDFYPEIEPEFDSKASTALFRIAQEALTMLFKRESIKSANLNVVVRDGIVAIIFSDDGIPTMSGGKEIGAATALASMRHRIRHFGGTVDIVRPAEGGTVLTARLPVVN